MAITAVTFLAVLAVPGAATAASTGGDVSARSHQCVTPLGVRICLPHSPPQVVTATQLTGGETEGDQASCTAATFRALGIDLPWPIGRIEVLGKRVTSFQWQRDGVDFGDAGSPYTTTADDVGHEIRCITRAETFFVLPFGLGEFNFGFAESASAPVSPAPLPPENSARPTISGTPQEGSRLTCQPGTWSKSPGFQYQWRRGSTAIGTGQTYTPTSDDVDTAIACRVTATSAGGSNVATSNPVTITAKPEPPKEEQPPKQEQQQQQNQQQQPPPPPVQQSQASQTPSGTIPATPATPNPGTGTPAAKAKKATPAGKCSRLKGSKRSACIKRQCGKHLKPRTAANKRKYAACKRTVTRRASEA